MALPWVEIKRTKTQGRIIGFCPDRKGRPQAMILVRDKIFAFRLGQLRVIHETEKLVRVK